MPPSASPPARFVSPWFGAGLLLAGGVCIGYAPIGLRLSEFGPQATAFWRYVFALPVLFAFAVLFEKAPPALPRGSARGVILLGGACFAADIALWHMALTLTSVANATFIVNLGNVGVGLLAWLVLKERPTLIWAVAALVALAGAGLLSLGAGGRGGTGDWRGDALALIAAVLVTVYMVASKQARRTLGPFSVLYWLTLVEAVVSGTITALAGESFLPHTLAGWIIPISLAIVAQAAGQGLILAGLGLTNTAIAGLIVLIQPVVAAALSYGVFGETLALMQLAGCALILFGIALSQRRGRRPGPAPN